MLNKKEFITEVIERVRETILPSEIIGQHQQLKKSGISHKGLCPFHNDKKMGSFIITDGKKIFKCFSCGTGGDVIKYYSLRNDLTYVESALKLALDNGIISYKEYESVTARRLSSKESYKIEKIYIEKDKKKFKTNIAEPKTLHLIYSLFIKGFSYLDRHKLSSEHEEHLIKERGLTKAEIEGRGYFTFPSRHIMKYFLKDLEENNIALDILKTIPGFFYDEKKDTWSFTTIKGGGIGIPISNEEGLVCGIQIRKDVIAKGDQRYIWFSSAFAQYTDGLEYGVSSGSPIDVVIPTEIKTQTIFITEGHFKAVKIAKDYSSISVSVQGVCAWASIVKMVEKIKKRYSKLNLKHIYIAYDGDMSYNTAVFQQAIKMGIALHGLNHNGEEKSLEECLNDEKKFKPKNIVSYCMWDDELGKGIDDLIFNGYGHKIDKIELSKLYPLYKNYLKELNENFIDSGIFKEVSEIDKKERKDLFEVRILSKLPKYKNI